MKKITLLLALFLLHTELFSATFHALIVADTTEQKIKRSSSIDIRRMQKAVRMFAKGSQKKLALTVLNGRDTTVQNIEKWFHKSRVGSHDILFFYFTGHGFASNSPQIIWPNLFFKQKKETISMDALQQVLSKKNAQLTIVLSDSCNKFGNANNNHLAMYVQPPSQVDISFYPKSRGLKKLFRHRQGKILASGAIRGTPSFGSDNGGFFTQAFLLSMKAESRRSRPSWKHLFQKTIKLLENAQKPQFRLFIKSK